MNITLSDSITLEELFAKVDEWGNLPTNSLSSQQIALISLRNTVFDADEDLKHGGIASKFFSGSCFICITGV